VYYDGHEILCWDYISRTKHNEMVQLVYEDTAITEVILEIESPTSIERNVVWQLVPISIFLSIVFNLFLYTGPDRIHLDPQTAIFN